MPDCRNASGYRAGEEAFEGDGVAFSDSVSRAFRLAVAAAGLRPIRLHDPRHTHASLLLADGEPIGNVSRRIGHADSNITAQVYEHYVPGAQKATATRFQNILKRAKDQAI